MGWSKMVLPTKEGGFNLCNPILLAKATTVRHAVHLWFDDNTWSNWMCARYVGDRALADILPRQKDSPCFLAILRLSPMMDPCVQLVLNFGIVWKLLDFKPTVNNIYNFFRPMAPEDPYALGI